MPTQESEEYRNQVQTRIQDLLAGKRPRDPYLSAISTRRLILEGVIEEVRIYRLRKEEKLRAERENEVKMSRHGDRYRRSNEKRQGRRIEDSGEIYHRHRSRDRSRRQGRSQQRDIPNPVAEGITDPVTSGRSEDNPELSMTGGAGSAGTLSPMDQHRRSRSRRRSPTRRHGPDGKTPFGELPKRVAGMGFGAHFVNTYRHIKAEHEAGHRSRGGLEKRVDNWRGRDVEDEGEKFA
jgi:hypothetical protein